MSLNILSKFMNRKDVPGATKKESVTDTNNINMSPDMLSRKYEEEQYLKYGIPKKKKCDTR